MGLRAEYGERNEVGKISRGMWERCRVYGFSDEWRLFCRSGSPRKNGLFLTVFL